MTDVKYQETRFLIVEDNLRYQKLLHESLEDYGYQYFKFANNSKQAHEILSSDYFDVIITDMRLGDTNDGILSEIKTRTITSIVIVLTANDSVIGCRRALREGAWDYISKNSRGDVMEILNQSILDALIYAEQWGNHKDEQWIQTHYAELWAFYSDKYIAVLNNQVIDHDANKANLKQRIQENNRPLVVPIIKHIQANDLKKIPLDQLIKRGEGERVEFKSTLQSDGIGKNDALVLASLKTIAAFLNTSGGILLIGVADNGTILGLDADIKLLGKHKNIDGFEQVLITHIQNKMSNAFSPFITIRFESLADKQVCVVTVKNTNHPVFVKLKNDQTKFYIRAGCTTRALDVEEVYNYFQMRKPKTFED